MTGIINIDLYRVNITTEENVVTLSTLSEIRNISHEMLYQEKVLMLGALSTLLSSTFWQISAIYLALPVSGSHSIVSGLIGLKII